jgi:hypothetical protein
LGTVALFEKDDRQIACVFTDKQMLIDAETKQHVAQLELARKEAAEARHLAEVARIEHAFCTFKTDCASRQIVDQIFEGAIKISHGAGIALLEMPRRAKTELHRRLYRLMRSKASLEKGSERLAAAAEAAVALQTIAVGSVTQAEASPDKILQCLEALMAAFEPMQPMEQAEICMARAAKQEIAGAYDAAEQSYKAALVALRDVGTVAGQATIDLAVAGEDRVRSLAAIDEFPGGACGLREACQRAITHGVFITAKSKSAWGREVGILDRARAVAVALHHTHTESEVEHALVGLGRGTVHHLSKAVNNVREVDPDGQKVWHSDLELVLGTTSKTNTTLLDTLIDIIINQST